MNRLPLETQALILSQLVEGSSIRSIERVTGVHRDTILRLLKTAGEMALDVMDTQMVNLEIKRLEVDEIWTFVAKKQRNVTEDDTVLVGDQWVFVGIDPVTKLVPAFALGKRTLSEATRFMYCLKSRIRTRFQLTTDSLAAYTEAVDFIYGDDIDYAQLHKQFKAVPGNTNDIRYSPGCIVGITKKVMTGFPDRKYVSTSMVERQNLTMRTQLRRFTRLSLGFSKKFENLKHALAIHFFWYNFGRIHESLRVTPAMQAKVTNHLWSWHELLTPKNQSQAA